MVRLASLDAIEALENEIREIQLRNALSALGTLLEFGTMS